MHHAQQALRAYTLYHRDVEYVVKDGQVIIVDEFTGRLMLGRRYSDGLHQAIEAKEGVKIEKESQTLATITFQNYFRMYDKLAGMTGTAKTEEAELTQIYNLPVVTIPTDRPMIRKDAGDLVYKHEKAKLKAVADEIAEWYAEGPPGARRHAVDREERGGVGRCCAGAASRTRSSTRSTTSGRRRSSPRRAGRGPSRSRPTWPGAAWTSSSAATRRIAADGEKVRALGGLHIVGTERHEARRIDNQLRGRAGRQGDPGSSRFFVALDDELMRLFAGERIAGIMERLGIEDDVPIEAALVTRQIENAQKKVESYHFDVRKHVLEYDDVMNVQRQVIYGERRKMLEDASLRDNILDFIAQLVDDLVAERLLDGDPAGGVGSRRAGAGAPGDHPARGRRDGGVAARRERRGESPSAWSRRRWPRTRRRSRRWGPRRCASWSASSCCRPWTASGSTTCTRWTRSGRASGCAPTGRRTRSSSIRRKATRCSSR